jgi:hypothetical protein
MTDHFTPNESLGGTIFTLRFEKSNREIKFRFHSILSVMIELAAATFCEDGVKNSKEDGYTCSTE